MKNVGDRLRAWLDAQPELRRRYEEALLFLASVLVPFDRWMVDRWHDLGALRQRASERQELAPGRKLRRSASGTPIRGLEPGSSPDVAVAATDVVSRLWRGIGHQVRAARESEASTRPSHTLADARGRRLRASAHGRRRRSTRRGGDAVGSSSRLMPLAVKGALVIGLCLAGFMGSSQIFIDYAAELPDVHQLTDQPVPSDTIVYAADGSEIADYPDPYTKFQHYQIPLTQMGTWLPEASVAIEDSNFWHEPGVDPYGIARAAVADATEGSTSQGASTITQELVKVRLLQTDNITYTKKIQEMILAIQVERSYTKKQILSMYLNSVQYGDFATGAQAAAENYFAVPAAKLDLAQAAMLAGIPRNPNIYSPLSSVENAKYRQKQVLDRMVQLREITQKQATAAYNEALNYGYPSPEIKQAPSFAEWVYKEMVTMYGQQAANQGGLHVYTSLNPGIQAIAQSSVTGGVTNDRNLGHHVEQGALASVDPKTGEVTALVGSAFPNGFAGQFNWASDIPTNPGSSVKLFTYTEAIASRKFTMVTPIPDAPINVSEPGFSANYSPTNYIPTEYPSCVMQTCLGNSLNIPAVYTELATGESSILDLARSMGAMPFYPESNGNYTQSEPDSAYGPTFTLGGYGETPLQMAIATATLADGGVYHPATGILKVTDSAGQAIYNYNPAAVAQQVVSPQVAFIMAEVMSNNNDRSQTFGTDNSLYFPSRIIAGKTGTYDNFVSSFVLGFNPSLASAIWVGNPSGASMGANFDSIFAAAPAWHNFMASALTAMNVPGTEWYAEPSGLVNGSKGTYFLPGTSASTPTPPLPSWASVKQPPKTTPKKTTGGGGNGNGNGGGH
jgi:membrane peptidoglycan carboxypeptidase